MIRNVALISAAAFALNSFVSIADAQSYDANGNAGVITANLPIAPVTLTSSNTTQTYAVGAAASIGFRVFVTGTCPVAWTVPTPDGAAVPVSAQNVGAGTFATTTAASGSFLLPVAGFASLTFSTTSVCTGSALITPTSSQKSVAFPPIAGAAGATPIAYPTDAAGRQIISPTGLPTPLALQPVSGAFPTPLAVQPISGAPTPIPYPTDASGRQIISPSTLPTPPATQAVTGAFPTPQPLATDASGRQVISPTNLPTPLAVQPISGAPTPQPLQTGANGALNDNASIASDLTGSLTNTSTAPTTSRAVQTIGLAAAAASLTTVSTGTGTTQVAGASVSANLNGASTAVLFIGGTYSIAGAIEATYDTSTWIPAQYIASNAATAGFLGISAITPNAMTSFQVYAPGAVSVRFRVTTYTSGTGAAVLYATPFSPIVTGSTTSVNGAIQTIATNTTLAAATFSGVASVSYCKSESFVFAATTTATGTLTVYGANDTATGFFGTIGTPTSLANGANGFVLSLPAPVRYVKLQSSVALTAYSANVTCAY